MLTSMNPRLLALVLVVFGAFGLAGCSTPETRIKSNPAVFARLTPAEQDLIKQGQVAIGFDTEMVKLAVGEPDRISERTDASGKTVIWSYTTYETTDGVLLYRGGYHRAYRWNDPLYPYFMSAGSRRDRDYFKVTFKDGRVTSIEKETR